MSGWNLPNGCTDADIDRAMYVDDEASCFDCELWEPIYCAGNKVGICDLAVARLSDVYNGHDIAEYCVTKSSDVCSDWRNYS